MEESDQAIIARVLDGDTYAFSRLVERHKRRCLRYSYRVLGDRDEADDVTQETFVRAFRALHKCVNPDRFKAWLFQILVNRCRSALERRITWERWFVRTNVDRLVDSRYEEYPNLSQAALLERALSQLAPMYREAILLKYVEKMTYREMARMTGCSAGTLRMRVSRGGVILRAKLKRKR
jgi:RNA polymerase sigma-70 factor (ECF subfamily)